MIDCVCFSVSIVLAEGIDFIGPNPPILTFTTGQSAGDIQCAEVTILDDSILDEQRNFSIRLTDDIGDGSDGGDGGGGGGSDGGGGGGNGGGGGGGGGGVQVDANVPSISINIAIDIDDSKLKKQQ